MEKGCILGAIRVEPVYHIVPRWARHGHLFCQRNLLCQRNSFSLKDLGRIGAKEFRVFLLEGFGPSLPKAKMKGRAGPGNRLVRLLWDRDSSLPQGEICFGTYATRWVV